MRGNDEVGEILDSGLPFDALSFESEPEGSSLRVEDRVSGRNGRSQNYADLLSVARTYCSSNLRLRST